MSAKRSMVYVIDDDESVRRAFGRLFRSADVDVETFSSPDEFLSDERQIGNACIVVDIRMPGLNGFDLMKGMADKEMCIPVIVISASDDVQVREHARELGAVSFFLKPVDDQALLDAVWWAISGAREQAKTKDK